MTKKKARDIVLLVFHHSPRCHVHRSSTPHHPFSAYPMRSVHAKPSQCRTVTVAGRTSKWSAKQYACQPKKDRSKQTQQRLTVRTETGDG